MPQINALYLFIGLCGLLALLFLIFSIKAFKQKQLWGGLGQLSSAVIFLLLATVAGLLGLATWGYKALSFEETAAIVTITELSPQRFRAQFNFIDGSSQTLTLAGDQLYVDAKIIKWHPFANLLGFRTLYELDRVSGRYDQIEDEESKPRTLYSLELERSLDLFRLSRQFKRLHFLVDAEYGSATFSDIENAEYQLNVTTSGLIMRKLR